MTAIPVLMPPQIHSVPNPGSNACGLRIGAHAPCYLEVQTKPVEWNNCILRLWLKETLIDGEDHGTKT